MLTSSGSSKEVGLACLVTIELLMVWSYAFPAGARYTKSIASLELRHKEHNNDSYPLHNNTIDFTQ